MQHNAKYMVVALMVFVAWALATMTVFDQVNPNKVDTVNSILITLSVIISWEYMTFLKKYRQLQIFGAISMFLLFTSLAITTLPDHPFRTFCLGVTVAAGAGFGLVSGIMLFKEVFDETKTV